MAEGRESEGLKSLGRKTEYRSDYAPEVLETFVNKHQDNDYWVRFNESVSDHGTAGLRGDPDQLYS